MSVSEAGVVSHSATSPSVHLVIVTEAGSIAEISAAEARDESPSSAVAAIIARARAATRSRRAYGGETERT